MHPLLTYLAPPFLGAFIGYMTNYVAIRMLFRPLKPWHFLGMRIPMTPGVIPGKRHELAGNIGEMVGEHLLTGTDIRRGLSEEKFTNELQGVIDDRIAKLLQKELGPVPRLIPDRFRSYFIIGLKILRWRSMKHLAGHMNSDAFAQDLSMLIISRIDAFLAQDLDDILSPASRAHFYGTLESSITDFLASPEVEHWIQIYIDEKISGFLAEKKCLQDLLQEELTQLVLELIEQEIPRILEKVATRLAEPDMQDRIASSISMAIQNFSITLGPLAAFIMGFINQNTIERKVKSYLNDRGDEFAQWLLDPTIRNKIAQIIKNKVEEILSTPVVDLLNKVNPEKIQKAQAWISGQIAVSLKNPKTGRSFAGLIRDALETQTDRPLHDILVDVAGIEKLENGKARISDEIIAVLRAPHVRRLLDEQIGLLIEEKVINRPVGRLADFLPRAVQDTAGDYMLQFVGELLIREVPALVDSLDIKEVVTRKVDSLNLLRLEELLLSIMQEQFKYINLFGALLGFIIGLFNLIFLFSL